jgi:hydrogenase-4 component F
MTTLAVLVALLPFGGALAVATGGRARGAGWATALAGAATLAAAAVLAVRVVTGGPVRGWSGYVHVDALGAFFLVTVALVVLLASLGSAAYLRVEQDRGTLSALQVRVYFIAFAVFAAMMLASLETGNLGLLWVLVEASTLASAVLVALEARPTSLEAAWKYIIISSFGVTIALVATLFLFYAASALPLGAAERLTWPALANSAGQHALRPDSLRLAFLLGVIGYGTKVGLAPMHTWLPDAHAEAPSPASAMLSAALLNTGMYAIIRFRAIAAAALGSGYTSRVLLLFGFASIVVGVLFMIRQANFKRLYAYSSIEHMGIVAAALGFGGTLGLYGALLHALNHALAKAVAFLASGDVVLRYRTRSARRVRGTLTTAPFFGGVLLLASLALLGSPPFGLFLSELTIVRAGFAHASPALAALLLALLAIAFVALLQVAAGMAVGTGPLPSPGAASGPGSGSGTGQEPGRGPSRPTTAVAAPASPYRTRTLRLLAAAPLAGGMALLLVLGLWVPHPLDSLILRSIEVIR